MDLNSNKKIELMENFSLILTQKPKKHRIYLYYLLKILFNPKNRGFS